MTGKTGTASPSCWEYVPDAPRVSLDKAPVTLPFTIKRLSELFALLYFRRRTGPGAQQTLDGWNVTQRIL